MDIKKFAAWFGGSEEEVAALLAEGLPHSGGNIDQLQAAEWLEKKGYGQRQVISGVVSTLAAVAQSFGVSFSTVKQEWRRSGMPGCAGHWDLAEIAAWKSLREKNPAALEAGGSKSEEDRAEFRRRLAADVRIREADARRRERENRLAEGGIVLRDDVDRAFAEMIVAVRTAFKRIPRKLMPRFPADQAVELAAEIEREIDDVLNMLSKWRPQIEDQQ